MKNTIHTRKAFAIITKDRERIFCGRYPHERMADVSTLSLKEVVRLFPNRPMAETFMNNNLSYVGIDNLEVVEVEQSLTVM